MIKPLTETQEMLVDNPKPIAPETDWTDDLKAAARTNAREAQELAARKAQELKDLASIKLQQAKIRAEYDTRNHPGRNLMIAFAIGFGIGLIYRR